MKAIAIDDFGGVERLHLEEFPDPTPLAQEVQIAVHYSGVNPVDWKICAGMLKGRIPHEFPIILGWEASGVVTAVGPESSKFKVGDEVYTYCRKPIIKWGAYAEYLVVDEQHVALKPKNISFAQAAGIPLAALTAWQALHDVAQIKNGESILIHAGAGGVGGFAIQFAALSHAKIYTTARKKNHSYVHKLGAIKAFDYSQEDFASSLLKLEPDGVDIVFDTVGGKTLQDSLAVLKKGGRVIGIVEKVDPDLASQYEVFFSYVFVAPNGDQLKTIAELIENGDVIPLPTEEIPLEKAAVAHEKLRDGHTVGKVVLKVH